MTRLRVRSMDPAFEDGLRAATAPRFALTIKLPDATARVPCPSPWRHPIRWLRWNPFLTRPMPTNIHLPSVALREDG